jgi:hypothetical protein
MRAYLLKVDEKTWRQIRAQVRWSYIKQSYEPPRRLVRFIPVALPANPYDWKEYADEITRIRRERVRNSALERQKRKQDRRIRQRRDYQRNYMREYRDRLRRGTV